MLSEDQANKIIETIAEDIPGFIAAALVDIESGMTLGLFSTRSDFDLSSASAYNSELVKQKQKIMEAIGLHSSLEDMIMTLSDQIHLIKLVGDGSFLYLAADRAGSNLAIIRNAVRKYEAELAF
jgi:predicted regulator of Ras-like GTPase activity (Roadblock/LC7/MglB family)